ncbi:MAG: DNA repair protein RadC [Nitrospirota bacterium]|jgi:DNA repair protein RadC
MLTPHYLGHRRRLRERFRKTGFGGFRDYEVLELLLTFCIPRRDVKPLAKTLIGTFGGLREVLDAPAEDLLRVDGLGENSATFLAVLKDCITLYLREGARSVGPAISSTRALLDYCRAAMAGLRDEQFRTLFFNTQNELLADEVVHEGTVDQAVVYPRKIMEQALLLKATALILVHNHPGGSARPSREDKLLTEEIVRIARGLRIRVHDHVIITPGGYYSFLEKGDL